MALASTNFRDLERNSIIESTVTAGQAGWVVLNSDGSRIDTGALVSTTDSVTSIPGASASVTGVSTLRNIDIDNTAQALKVSAGNLYGIQIYNLNTTPVWLHFYNAIIANVTPTSTTPKKSIMIPPGDGVSKYGAYTEKWDVPTTFTTAASYMACTQANPEAGTATDPTVGLIGNFDYI